MGYVLQFQHMPATVIVLPRAVLNVVLLVCDLLFVLVVCCLDRLGKAEDSSEFITTVGEQQAF